MKVELHIESVEEARIVNRCLLEIAMHRDMVYELEKKARREERERELAELRRGDVLGNAADNA